MIDDNLIYLYEYVDIYIKTEYYRLKSFSDIIRLSIIYAFSLLCFDLFYGKAIQILLLELYVTV